MKPPHGRRRSTAFSLAVTAACIMFSVTATPPAQAATQATNATAAPKATVSVVGLRIIAKPYANERDMSAFGGFAGTSVALLVKYPAGGLVKILPDDTKLTAFTDDKGTNLLPPKRIFSFKEYQGSNVSKDGKAAVVNIREKDLLPAPGATHLHLTGTLVLKTAKGSKTFTQKNVALKVGGKIKAGPVSLTITKIGKPHNAWFAKRWPVQIEFANNGGFERVASIKFLDTAGKLVKYHLGTTMGANGHIAEGTFLLGKKIKSATLQIAVWQGMKKITVPFDVAASVGLK